MLLVGDDWAEDHHDVGVMDPAGRTLARARDPRASEAGHSLAARAEARVRICLVQELLRPLARGATDSCP